jgi:hypothetical protein
MGGLTFHYGNFVWGLLMLILGVPLGLSIAHFASVVLRVPGALACTAIARNHSNDDLIEISRRSM